MDRLARSLPDARDIVDELTARNACPQIGASLQDPTDPVGHLLFNVLAMVAEFEGDLIRARTREGMRITICWAAVSGCSWNVARTTDITMLILTNEVQFARDVSNRVMMFDAGRIVEEGSQQLT